MGKSGIKGIFVGGALAAVVLGMVRHADAAGRSERPPTFCNPIDLSYRFSLNGDPAHGSFRDVADATMVFHKGEFWLFASQCGGYWHSKDMVNWNFIEPTGFPLEDYAPTIEVVDGKWVVTTSTGRAIYESDDPATGQWTKTRDYGFYADPALFVDDDGRVYLYYGSSPDRPIMGVEVDPEKQFEPVGEATALIPGLAPLRHGWEAKDPLASDEQILQEKNPPWMEAALMSKHRGTYYLQYAAPATETRWYADGVYVSDKPLGPFHYAPYNPFSYKPTGFVTAAGHSSTYQDGAGRHWHVASVLVGVRNKWERRLGIFPTGFLPNGSEPDQLVCNTYLGDYPQLAPGHAKDPLKDNLAGWMLLSYRKPATASSTLDDRHKPELACNEDIRTWWAAATGNPGEWLEIDMGKTCRIDAVQINFGDMNANAQGLLRNDAYRYVLEVSEDGKTWRPCIDRKDNQRDAAHEYIQLDRPVKARYAKLTNVHTPVGAVFSVSGLRLFGSGLGKAPEEVRGVVAERQANRRMMTVSWEKSPGADFHIVRYGIKPDRLTLNYQVYDGESVTIPGLNADQDYFVAVDAVNDSGVTQGTQVQPVLFKSENRN